MNTKKTERRKDVYQLVTDRVIEQLEKGVIPWASPISKQGMPKSLTTKKEYRGINPFLLCGAPYDSRYWLTFGQARKLGGTIRKGEKGSLVVYWHWRTEEQIERLRAKTPEPAPCYPFYSTVFNLEQAEGIKAPQDDTKTFEHSPIEEAERIIKEMPNAPKIEYTHDDKPRYSRVTDMVAVPVARRFERAEDFYCTLFHELAHATGHESRLNRVSSKKHRSYGLVDYSFEELVAEMTAAFLCAHCGIENQVEQSAAYVEGWLNVFRQDKKILLDAATAAQRAADYIRGQRGAGDKQQEEYLDCGRGDLAELTDEVDDKKARVSGERLKIALDNIKQVASQHMETEVAVFVVLMNERNGVNESEAEDEQEKECPHCLRGAKAGIDERLMTYEERQALQKVLDYLVEESNDYEARKQEGDDVSNHIWESMVILIDYLTLEEYRSGQT